MFSPQEAPCCFRHRLDSLCPKRWMKANGFRPAITEGGEFETMHHIYLSPWGETVLLCGPYWRSMIDAFRVELLDTVTFTFNEENNLFDIQVVSNNNDVKLLHGFPGLFKFVMVFCRAFNLHTR